MAHAALFGLLSLGFLAVQPPVVVKQVPIEVSLTDETALISSAPVPSNEAPASGKPAEAQPEPEQPVETPPEPQPAKAKPQPSLTLDLTDRHRPDRTAKPAQPQRKATGDPLPDYSKELGPAREPNTNKSSNPSGQVSGPVRAALLNQLRLMLKPNWSPPSGSDTDKLKTWVRITLRPNGTVANVEFLRQEGRTDLNRAQWGLHQERAIAAVRKTRFDTAILKDEYYSVWGKFDTYFDKRL